MCIWAWYRKSSLIIHYHHPGMSLVRWIQFLCSIKGVARFRVDRVPASVGFMPSEIRSRSPHSNLPLYPPWQRAWHGRVMTFENTHVPYYPTKRCRGPCAGYRDLFPMVPLCGNNCLGTYQRCKIGQDNQAWESTEAQLHQSPDSAHFRTFLNGVYPFLFLLNYLLPKTGTTQKRRNRRQWGTEGREQGKDQC